MVQTKDVVEVHKQKTSNGSNKVKAEWVLEQCKGFKAYKLSNSFLMFMKENEELVTVNKEVPGLYYTYERNDDYQARFTVKEASEGPEFDELVELARKLTPPDKKLSFRPGKYLAMAPKGWILDFEELTGRRNDSSSNANLQETTRIPMNFKLVVGKGDFQFTIETNRDIMIHFFPSLMAKVENIDQLDCLDLQLRPAVTEHPGYAKIRIKRAVEPTSLGCKAKYEQVKSARRMFTLNYSSTDNSSRHSLPMDVTFLAGSGQEEILGNRAVLATLNPVLARILFGTGCISVDPSRPIDWTQFDAAAVRTVLAVFMSKSKRTLVIPLDVVDSTKMLVDYLMETPESLNIEYETIFETSTENGFILQYDVGKKTWMPLSK